MDDRIRVRIKSTGAVGTIPRSKYDPNIYEEVGGSLPAVPETQTTQSPETNTSQIQPNAGTTQGLDLNKIHILLGLLAAGKGQYGTASAIFARTKESATEVAKKQQVEQAKSVSKQLDSLIKDWDKMKWYERLPLPGIARISPQRTKYETLKGLYNTQLILLWEDKRITDAQRKLFEAFFPDPLMSKTAARARIEAIKEIINNYAQVVSPYKYQNQPQTTDLNTLLDYLNEK